MGILIEEGFVEQIFNDKSIVWFRRWSVSVAREQITLVLNLLAKGYLLIIWIVC